MKFDHKIIRCDCQDIHTSAAEYRDIWVSSLLLRMRVDSEKVNKAQYDMNYTSREWRNDLFYDHGLAVIKHPDKVEITKRNARESLVIGQWKEPEVVRVNKGKERYCELHLDYWQLV